MTLPQTTLSWSLLASHAIQFEMSHELRSPLFKLQSLGRIQIPRAGATTAGAGPHRPLQLRPEV